MSNAAHAMLYSYVRLPSDDQTSTRSHFRWNVRHLHDLNAAADQHRENDLKVTRQLSDNRLRTERITQALTLALPFALCAGLRRPLGT